MATGGQRVRPVFHGNTLVPADSALAPTNAQTGASSSAASAAPLAAGEAGSDAFVDACTSIIRPERGQVPVLMLGADESPLSSAASFTVAAEQQLQRIGMDAPAATHKTAPTPPAQATSVNTPRENAITRAPVAASPQATTTVAKADASAARDDSTPPVAPAPQSLLSAGVAVSHTNSISTPQALQDSLNVPTVVQPPQPASQNIFVAENNTDRLSFITSNPSLALHSMPMPPPMRLQQPNSLAQSSESGLRGDEYLYTPVLPRSV